MLFMIFCVLLIIIVKFYVTCEVFGTNETNFFLSKNENFFVLHMKVSRKYSELFSLKAADNKHERIVDR